MPQSKGVLVLILLTDTLNSFIREAISFSGNNHTNAIITVVFFALVLLFVFGPSCSGYIIHLFYKENYKQAIIALVEVIGALLYYYGDNIGYIISRYSEVLGCHEDCRYNNRVAATVTLGLSLVLFQLIPPCIETITKRKQQNVETVSTYLLLSIILKILR